ncbi:TetR/AcrR family transcriptional regulator [Paenibacillus donghaensis]|uniref:TetR family transcriptional regulator n=1 Tax=Paenibacillus donghaensis TaxID=414771 RepID=A0A2Z2KCN8_9BACL|nr:TetR/AcrR family transcriptional regulator [Paenibacillus donghaensis]ASA21505.1 TetR family transcriptional regulator [Paenibacillus donghaensis]
MPKKFSEAEKNRIQQKLLESGRSLVSRYGFKKTSVDELTKGAGIAAGTFYGFYQSKEELFFELVEVEENRIRTTLLEHAANRPVDKESFKLFLLESFQLMSNNPIIQQILLTESFEAILRKLPPERLERNYNEDQDILLPFIQKWQTAGVLTKKSSPELIVSMIRSLFLLSLHKREIGEAVYDDTLKLLITTMANGLFARD